MASGQKPTDNRPVCHDCKVREGEFHKPGCDMERCPFCGGQLFVCNCALEKLGLFDKEKYGPDTDHLPPDIYENGLTDELAARWEAILRDKGLIPFIEWPTVCAKCGMLWPALFKVPDEEWQHYIQPDKRRTVVCRTCYDYIKTMVDAAEARTHGG